MYQHKGAYWVRAWMVPGGEKVDESSKPKGKAALLAGRECRHQLSRKAQIT